MGIDTAKYDQAESAIRRRVWQSQPIMPHQLVQWGTWRGYDTAIFATSMWDLIGRGVLNLSDTWELTYGD